MGCPLDFGKKNNSLGTKLYTVHMYTPPLPPAVILLVALEQD